MPELDELELLELELEELELLELDELLVPRCSDGTKQPVKVADATAKASDLNIRCLTDICPPSDHYYGTAKRR